MSATPLTQPACAYCCCAGEHRIAVTQVNGTTVCADHARHLLRYDPLAQVWQARTTRTSDKKDNR